MRWIFVVPALAFLIGCERPVLSHRALFKPADGQTAPAFREGLWLSAPSEDCAVDIDKPAAQWPDCADWTLIAQNRIVRTKRVGRQTLTRVSVPFVLAAGDPRILQEPALEQPGFYRFTAARPLQYAADGKITVVETWSVVCPNPPGQGERAVEVPGLRIGRTACYVRDRASLNQTLAQDAELSAHQTLRWVRDGDR